MSAIPTLADLLKIADTLWFADDSKIKIILYERLLYTD